MTNQTSERHFDAVVVGGGQAGLAVGYHLARQNRAFVILDAESRVGDVWRNRWDSLRLFTPARYDACRGCRFQRLAATFRPRTRWPTTSRRTLPASIFPYGRA